METYYLVILGIIQGVAEWLPISSQAQTMFFMMDIMKVPFQTALTYAIFLHAGTLLAVVVRYWNQFLDILKKFDFEDKLTRTIVFATIATAITAVPLFLILKYYILELPALFVNAIIGVLLIVTGVLLKIIKPNGAKGLENLEDTDSIVVGLAQGFSILPGISRSGVTLVTLIARNIGPELALTLSFMLSAPAVLGAILIDFDDISKIPVFNAVVLTASAFVVGYFTMNILLKYAQMVKLWVFAIVLGVLVLSVAIILMVIMV